MFLKRKLHADCVLSPNIFNKPIDATLRLARGATVVVNDNGNDLERSVIALYITAERTHHVKCASFSKKSRAFEPIGKRANAGSCK